MSNILDYATGDGWVAHHGDCVEVLRVQPSDSIDYSIFSPPFASLYVYSPSDRDLGNCATHEEFYDHMSYLVPEMLRVTKAGRLLSFHCMQLPTSLSRDGYIGLTDFRGILIRVFQEHGWIYHSEVCIWKDPVTAMQRTKALGLLHKTIRGDASMSRQGIADYLVTMRKPGKSEQRIQHVGQNDPTNPLVQRADDLRERQRSVEVWQRYASPVWAAKDGIDDEGFAKLAATDDGTEDGGILPGDTLQFRSARENEDDRHICPLQLSVIRRAIRLWTNPRDVVLSPFMGIGSEGYVALTEGRRFVGAELKKTYFDQAARNLKRAASEANQPNLLTLMGVSESMEGAAQ